MSVERRRICLKRKNPNPIFQSWLEELLEEAKTKKSRLEPILQEALVSLSKYPLPLHTGAECIILEGFDKKLCTFLDRRLNVYISQETSNEPVVLYSSSSNSQDSQSASSNGATSSSEPVVLVQQGSSSSSKDIIPSRRKYKPVYRSGSYAILIALLEHTKASNNEPINKEKLIELAQQYSEESFTRKKPESFYTAWSSMSTLLKKNLVNQIRGKQAKYTITEEGILLAEELLKEYKGKQTINDIIFNSPPTSEVAEDNGHASSQNGDTRESEDVRTSSEIDYIEMPAGSFDVILLIDKQETSGCTKKTDPTVAQFKKYPDLKHEYRSLKVGDFTWIARCKHTTKELVLPYIVERKRMDDLGASIKDGRFHEQKFRLRKCGLKNVLYLVEQYGSNKHVGLPVNSLMQALANTRVQDGFKVHMTDSLGDSARFLAMMTKRLTIEYKDQNLRGCNRESQGTDLMAFEFFNKAAVKNKPLTVTETFIKLLLQLKGVSVEKALAVAKVYGTPKSLFDKYEECDRKEGEMLLAKLKHGLTNHNIGPKVSKAIYQLFC